MLQSLAEFPQRQESASFNLEQVMAKLQEGTKSSQCIALLEHEIAHETRHSAQVVRLADVQEMVAREPMKCAAVPVPPQQFGLLWRGETITQTGDDQSPVLGHQGRVV